jgi:hypothetical protein
MAFAVPGAQQPARPPAAAPPERPAMSSGSRILPPRQEYQLPSGRKLVYEVEWRLWTAGTATLRTDAAGAEQKVTASADSTGVVALLYTVHDSFEAFFDPKTFCSSRITKKIEEGFRKREMQIRFDNARRKAVLNDKNLKSGAVRQVERDTPGCVTDVISAFFYIASLPLAEGATYIFPLNDGGEMVDVRVNVEGTEEVTTPAGTYRAIRVQPEAAQGVVKERGKMWIWYSDDAERLPVQMRARLFWGTLTLRLQRVER